MDVNVKNTTLLSTHSLQLLYILIIVIIFSFEFSFWQSLFSITAEASHSTHNARKAETRVSWTPELHAQC